MDEPTHGMDYWNITFLGQGSIKVTANEARKVIKVLEEGIQEFVTFLDLSGSTCFIRTAQMEGIYENTYEQREWERAWATLRKSEDPIE